MVYTHMYNMINVYTWYIHVCTYWGIVYTILYTVQSIQIYVYTDFTWITTGFHGKHCRKADRTWFEVKCGCEQSTLQHVHCMYIVYTCIYLYIPSWTLNTDFIRIWMQDTTVGAWVVYAVMLHDQQAIGPDLNFFEMKCGSSCEQSTLPHVHLCTVGA